MSRFVDWIKGFALAWGGPGLFLIGYLDSSFLSFPEVNDLLIVWMVTLYYIARKGGQAFLKKRFHERHIDRGLQLFQKYGLLMVIVPALLPPPAPFKIFVLLAGV